MPSCPPNTVATERDQNDMTSDTAPAMASPGDALPRRPASGTPVRILLVNPNTTAAMTDTMVTIARDVSGGRAEIRALTADRGFPYIASRAEAQIGGQIAIEMIAEHGAEADVAIIAAFGDPGLAAAREIFDIPVIGMAEAALMSAAMLGESFAVVTFSPFMTRWYADCVAGTGLAARCRGVRAPARRDIDVSRVRDESREAVIALARAAALKDGADVIVLGGAPLAGLARDIAAEVPAIVLDPISAAIAQALALASITAPGSLARRAGKPEAKSSRGLPPRLAARIAGEAV